jgi:hypothetical protein
MKKNINEQSQKEIDLVVADQKKCFDNYKWFTKDTGRQPKKTKSGKLVISGKNGKNESILFFDDGIVINAVTKVKKRWSCEALTTPDVTDQNKITPLKEKQNQHIAAVMKRNQGIVSPENVSEVDIRAGKYEKIDLNSHPEYGNPDAFPQPGKDFLYLKKTELTPISSEQDPIIAKFTGAGYTVIDCKTQDTDDFAGPIVNLKQKYPSVFTTDFCLVQKIDFSESGNSNQWNDYLNTEKDNFRKNLANPQKSYCRKLINNYANAISNDYPVGNSAMLLTAKQLIQRCDKIHKFSFGTLKNLEIINNLSKDSNKKYSLQESNLSKTVKKNLLEMKENKKSFLVEQSIIKNRFNLIIESSKLHNNIEISFLDFLVETIKLREVGFDNKVILSEMESFVNLLSGIFGGSGVKKNLMGTLRGTLVEFAVKTLLSKLGLNPKSAIGRLFITSLGNIQSFSDIPKLFTDCNYVSELLSKSIVESIIGSLGDKYVASGIVPDAVRNSLTDLLYEQSFMKSIQSSISGSVCSILGGIKDKMENKAKEMKSKALSK